MQALMPDGTTWTIPEGGFYSWVTLPEGLDANTMLPRALTELVAYVPGSGFYADGQGAHNLRLSYCYPDPDRIREGVRRLSTVIEAEIELVNTFGPPPTSLASPKTRFLLLKLISIKGICVHILVLSGGLSPERDVSLRSGRRVAEALRASMPEVEITESDITAETIPSLESNPPDCVISMVHGSVGEDGSLRSVLEALGIPFVGSGSQASRIAFDKGVTSSLLPKENIPRFVALPQSFFKEMGANSVIRTIIGDLGMPLIVKPLTGGSALGVTKCVVDTEVPTALVTAFGYSDFVMIQQAKQGSNSLSP